MKIISVRFKNLNSLRGEWLIDFSVEEYAANGIFAIVGATGAGKSTVLDAISLALYGRTPRLKQLSKSSNELMNRQSGECFAEVDFLSVNGHFRCHWSQHRARRQPQGDLQPPRHELSEGGSGKILANKMREVAALVSSLTGMEFEQFTRAMLLAQGEFNTFLKAGSDDRAPLLEQITGTEIYSELSMEVHRRTAQEKQQTEALRQQMQTLNILSHEEEELCNRNLAEINRELELLKTKALQLGEQQSWHLRINQLSQDITNLQKTLEQLETSWNECAEQRSTLSRHEAALALQGLNSLLTQLEQQQEIGRQQLLTTEQQLNQNSAGLREAIVELQIKETRLEASRDRQRGMECIARVVTRLDQEIAEQKKHIAAIRTEEQRYAQKTAELQKRRELLDKQQNTLSRSIEALTTKLTQQEYLASLAEEFSGINEKLNRLAAITQQHIAQNKEVARLSRLVAEHSQKQHDDEKRAEQARQTLEKDRLQLDALDAALKKFPEPKRFYDSLQQCGQAEQLLRNLVRLGKQQLDKQKEAQVAERQMSKLAQSLQELAARHTDANTLYRLLSEKITKEEELLLLSKAVTSLSDEREKLVPGTPCPLCGSTSHPLADGENQLPPQPDLLQEQLKASRNQYRKQTELLTQLSTERERTAAEQTHLQQRLISLNKEIAELDAEKNTIQQSLQLDAASFSFADVEGLLTAKQDELSLMQKNRTELENTLELQQQCRTRVNENQELLQRQQEASAASSLKRATLEQQHSTAASQLAGLVDDGTKLVEDINQHLQQYRIAPVNSGGIDQAREMLRRLRDTYLQETQQLTILTDQLKSFEQRREQLEKEKAVYVAEQQQQRARREEIEPRCDKLVQQRQRFFGQRQPEQALADEAGNVREAEHNLQTTKDLLHNLEKEIAALSDRHSQLTSALTSRDTEIENGRRELETKLEPTIFTDREELQKALLSEERYGVLKAEISRLAQTRTEQSALLADCTSRLDNEKKRELSTVTLEELTGQLQELQARMTEKQERAGAEKERLTRHQQQLSARETMQQQLTSQELEYTYWAQLHELIGSADGKKFRNFAQGLTFERMVQHANSTLARMSDRYILVRNRNHPLELDIIDNYQGGLIRSTDNLSGGESFIVSLSLALGLAAMAGRNVRVDTLFLDEGFGTLDEEALETALDTLSSLYQEGKNIGVISHVPLLRERLAVQIRLHTGLGGRSTISGPGVKRLDK